MKELQETSSNFENDKKTSNNQDFLDLSHKLFKSLRQLKKLITLHSLLQGSQASTSNSTSFITTVDEFLSLLNQLIEYLAPFIQEKINKDDDNNILKGKEKIDLKTENDNVDSNSVSLNKMYLDNFITAILTSDDNEDEKKLISKLSQHLPLFYSHLLLLVSQLDQVKKARLSSNENASKETELEEMLSILREVLTHLFDTDSQYHAESQDSIIDFPITTESTALLIEEYTEHTYNENFEIDSKLFLEPSEKTFNSEFLESNDVMNTPVTSHLDPLNEREAAAKTIQTWWRQIYRAKYLHRTPALFNTTANTLNNGFIANILPSNLRHLALRPIPPLLTTTRHFSNKLENILHDGVIYPKYKTRTSCGFSTDFDSARFDDRLVFTTPHSSYPSYLNKGMTLDLARLITRNGPKGLYFKFFDWAKPFIHRIELCPEISFTICNRFPILIARFTNSKTGEVLATVNIPGNMCVYHGYSGLNEYLTFFIFKIISLLPEEFSSLKDTIYSHFTHLDQTDELITHLQSMMKALLALAEIDFVNSLKLNLDLITNIMVGNIIYNVDELKRHIALNDPDYIRQHFTSRMFSESFFFVSGMLQVAKGNGAQAIIDFVKQEFSPALAFYAELLERANYVYGQHLCKPFLDTNIDRTDASLTTSNGIIHRPNHGLAHTLRVASYVEKVVEYFQNFSNNPNFKTFCSQLTPEDILDIQTALLFSVSGRASELGFSVNPDLYNYYREISAVQYENFARSEHFPEDKISKFRELVRFLGNPNYVNGLQDESKSFIFHIMNLAHKLDLMRCFTLSRYLHAINMTNNLVVDSSPSQENALNELFFLVTKRTLATGDRMFCKFVRENITSEMNDYDHELFFKASTQPSICLALLQNRRPDTGTINEILSKSTALDIFINVSIDPILEDKSEPMLYKPFYKKNPNQLSFFSKQPSKNIFNTDDEILFFGEVETGLDLDNIKLS